MIFSDLNRINVIGRLEFQKIKYLKIKYLNFLLNEKIAVFETIEYAHW